MSRRSRTRRAAGVALVVALALPSAALAQRSGGLFFAGAAVDGPSADILAVGDLSIARDGSGAVAYVRRDEGVPHTFVGILDGGAVQSVARVDAGLPELLGRPALAASDGGRVVVAWATSLAVYAAVRPGAGQPFGAPQPIGPAGALDPSVDLAGTGVGYLAWARGGDIESAYLPRGATAFAAIPGALDGGDAGAGALRPRVAAAGDGIGLAVWGERDAAGRAHIVARRLVRGQPSAVSADATIDPGGSADSPDVGISDDSSFAWVAFREAVDNGSGGTVTRPFARRLRGSAFDEPVGLDGAPAAGASGAPRVGLNGRTLGMLTAGTPGGGVDASVVRDDAPAPQLVDGPVQVGVSPGPDPAPVGAYAENQEGVVAWFSAPSSGGAPEVRARTFEDDPSVTRLPPFGEDTLLSDPALGPVDPGAGLEADATRAGDAAVAFVQDGADGRRIVVAVYDRAPGTPSLNTTSNWRSRSRPDLVWSPAFDLWGPMSYQVLLDGQPYATTTTPVYTPPLPLADGTHRWQVIATDRRGQVAQSLTGTVRVDVTPPALTSSFSGQRIAGKTLKLQLGGSDLGSPAGSGLAQLRVDWGDGSLPVVSYARSVTLPHVYPRGTFVARLSAKDHAGNAVVRLWTLVIKKPKKPKKGKAKKPKSPSTGGSSPGGG